MTTQTNNAAIAMGNLCRDGGKSFGRKRAIYYETNALRARATVPDDLVAIEGD